MEVMGLNPLPTCDLEKALLEEAQDASCPLPPNFEKETHPSVM